MSYLELLLIKFNHLFEKKNSILIVFNTGWLTEIGTTKVTRYMKDVSITRHTKLF